MAALLATSPGYGDRRVHLPGARAQRESAAFRCAEGPAVAEAMHSGTGSRGQVPAAVLFEITYLILFGIVENAIE